MSEWFKVVFLGIVEGITEFLPVSSTGHLLVFSTLLNFENNFDGAFEIFIQIGGLAAVVVFFRHSLFRQATTFHKDANVRRLWRNVLIGTIPSALVGVLFLDFIKEHVFPEDTAPAIVATALIIGGFVFLWLEWYFEPNTEHVTTHSLQDISIAQAIAIGIFQMIAIIPGTSRSGASIVGGLLLGLDRKTATEYSFYLAMPILFGATTSELLSIWNELTVEQLRYFLLGALVSFVVAWIVVAWLLRYIATHSYVIFGYYRILAGCLLFLLLFAGIL